ncbi:MAG: sigma-54-dependent Fis family transcriptional regulator, partial [Bdellovibrionales bacterium]|nr:sigma-54-dependent Fis family transcriptional regulator [Bdellovibrionales bacterium]
MKILILNTPNNKLQDLVEVFQALNQDAASVASENALMSELRSGTPYDVVVIDLELGDGTKPGSELIQIVRSQYLELAILAVRETGTVEVANQAARLGASDFLVRGGDLHARVSTFLEKGKHYFEVLRENRSLNIQHSQLQALLGERYHIVFGSPAMQKLVGVVERIANVPRPVLILGERGVGKELIAHAIHKAGTRASRPFVAVNCAAFTDTLLESELFGHEKGAFTEANKAASGKFEQAAHGTIFLDEIGNMSLPFQQKIMRVAEYGKFTRVGGTGEIHPDVRIISATNADLEAKMSRGEFLCDLYDRLAFEVIQIPPLRERPEDIIVLAQHFFDMFMHEIPSFRGKRLSQSALDALLAYPFPGNVRELKTIIERATFRDTTNEITPEDLGLPSKSGEK